MNLPIHIREVYAKATCLYTRQEVEAALDRLAKEISAKVSDADPIFLCLVIGGIVPLGNLLPRLDFPLEVDYLHVTRYRSTTIGGEIEWRAKPVRVMKDRTVVIVDDILDGGITLQHSIDFCREQGAKKIFTVVLVDRVKKRKPEALQKADFTGLEVGDQYVFGYGMDYHEYLRNAPGIFAVVE